MSKLGKTNAEYGLIEEGDKILVGLSGGKDSLTMIHAMKEQQRRAPFKFEFIAVTVSYGMGENFDELIAHCKEHEIPHAIHDTKVYELAKEKIRKNSSYCSFFSRMRRGYLYSAAKKHGCNKVALGHHLDDAVESFFMNFTYNGQMRSLAPKYRAGNGLVVIRPLIQMRERQLSAFVLENNIKTIGDEACPSMRFDVKIPHARANTKKMLAKMEKEFPSLFTSLNAAFKNISVDSFFMVED
jgi:tRNA(Ile)-lysidine synthase TilS/MesJ